MKYQFITGHWNSDGSTTLYARNENGVKKEIKVFGKKPYYYIPENERTPTDSRIMKVDHGYKSIFGEDVKKILTENPRAVGEIREEARKHFEADIPFIRRFIIDAGIRSGFKAPSTRCVFNDLEPIDFQMKPTILYLDIEMYEGKVSGITLYNNKGKSYLTIATPISKEDHTEFKERDWIVKTVDDEFEILKLTKKVIKDLDPDIITGWYVEDFDIKKLKERMRARDVRYDFFKRCLIFDLLAAYRKMFSKGSHRLKDVVIEEGISEDVVADRYSDEMYEDEFEKFLKYNKKDVEYLVDINDKHQLIEFYWDIKNFIGMEEAKRLFYNSTLVDTLLLREAEKVLPSRRYGESGTYKGAIVFSPDAGIYENVGVYDFSKYYPNIIRAFNISPEYADIDTLKRFKMDEGVLPRLCDILIEERKKYDAKVKEMRKKHGKNSREYENANTRRRSLKFLLNSVYGFAGYAKSRIYNEDVAAEVTKRARDGLEILRDIAEDMGFAVRYGDTDSIMIDTPDISTGQRIEEKLNDALEDYTGKFGAPPLLKVKLERIFDRALFKDVKKRYAAHVSWAEGSETDSMYITGFEVIRTDTSDVTDELQEGIFNILLKEKGDKDDVKEFIREITNKVRDDEYSINEIAIKKTLSKDLDEYKANTDYIRGSKYANKYLGEEIGAKDRVNMVYVDRVKGKPHTDVICFLEDRNVPDGTIVDYDKMVERIIRKKVEDIIGIIGLGWNAIFSKNIMDLVG